MSKEFAYRKYEGKFGTVKVYANDNEEMFYDADKTVGVTADDYIEILCNGIIIQGTTTFKPIAVTTAGVICSAAADAIVTFTEPAGESE